VGVTRSQPSWPDTDRTVARARAATPGYSRVDFARATPTVVASFVSWRPPCGRLWRTSQDPGAPPGHWPQGAPA
jgi:hypothetical protein